MECSEDKPRIKNIQLDRTFSTYEAVYSFYERQAGIFESKKILQYSGGSVAISHTQEKGDI